MNSVRRLDFKYGASEFLWYMSGSGDINLLKKAAPSYETYADGYGAYGPRLQLALQSCIRILQAKPSSRQAVALIWHNHDIEVAEAGTTNDIPCTICLQFIARDQGLWCVTTMRSNDAWLGFPYDVYCFTTLQHIVARELNIQPASYIHNVGSMHLYEKHWEKARTALRYDGTCIPRKEYNVLPSYVSTARAAYAWVQAIRDSFWCDKCVDNFDPYLRDILVAGVMPTGLTSRRPHDEVLLC